MKKEQIILKIYKEISAEKNRELAMLKLFSLVREYENADELIEMYESVLQEELLIAEISSRVKLQKEEQEKLEQKVQKEFEDSSIIFDYQVDPEQSAVLVIKVNDKSMILDF